MVLGCGFSTLVNGDDIIPRTEMTKNAIRLGDNIYESWSRRSQLYSISLEVFGPLTAQFLKHCSN